MSRKRALASASASSLVFPEEKERETISSDTQVTIAGILERYNKKGEDFSSRGIDFAPITILAGISNLYLIKKYGTNCFMYGINSRIGEFIHGGFIINFLSGQIDSPITAEFLSEFITKNLIQIQNFLNCVKKGVNPVIIIPLALIFSDGGHHANMLIYKRDLNTFEHFEPHGSSFSLDSSYGDKIKTILESLVNKINELNNTPSTLFSNSLPNNISLVPSNEVCIRDRGLQAIQQELELFEIERGQYCQMWSLLFAELALLNPTISSKDILDQIFILLDSKNGPDFLSNVIRGYVSMLGEGISMYLSEYVNNSFTIENMSYIFTLFLPYADYLSNILQTVIDCEVNAELLLRAMPQTIAQLETSETRLQGKLSNYFRIQQEVKDLLINRKQNYAVRGKDRVDAEIMAKLMEELGEYSANRNDINSYIKNKVFKNFLISKQSSSPPKVSKAKSSRKGGKKYKKTRKYKKVKKSKKSKKYI
jgi:hypothetical protein